MVPINFSRGPLQFIRIAIKYNWVLLFLGFLWIEIEDSCFSVYKIPIHFHSLPNYFYKAPTNVI